MSWKASTQNGSLVCNCDLESFSQKFWHSFSGKILNRIFTWFSLRHVRRDGSRLHGGQSTRFYWKVVCFLLFINDFWEEVFCHLYQGGSEFWFLAVLKLLEQKLISRKIWVPGKLCVHKSLTFWYCLLLRSCPLKFLKADFFLYDRKGAVI